MFMIKVNEHSIAFILAFIQSQFRPWMILSWLYQRLSHRDTAEMVLSEYDQSLEVTLLVTPAQHLCPAHHEHQV